MYISRKKVLKRKEVISRFEYKYKSPTRKSYAICNYIRKIPNYHLLTKLEMILYQEFLLVVIKCKRFSKFAIIRISIYFH